MKSVSRRLNEPDEWFGHDHDGAKEEGRVYNEQTLQVLLESAVQRSKHDKIIYPLLLQTIKRTRCAVQVIK